MFWLATRTREYWHNVIRDESVNDDKDSDYDDMNTDDLEVSYDVGAKDQMPLQETLMDAASRIAEHKPELAEDGSTFDIPNAPDQQVIEVTQNKFEELEPQQVELAFRSGDLNSFMSVDNIDDDDRRDVSSFVLQDKIQPKSNSKPGLNTKALESASLAMESLTTSSPATATHSLDKHEETTVQDILNHEIQQSNLLDDLNALSDFSKANEIKTLSDENERFQHPPKTENYSTQSSSGFVSLNGEPCVLVDFESPDRRIDFLSPTGNDLQQELWPVANPMQGDKMDSLIASTRQKENLSFLDTIDKIESKSLTLSIPTEIVRADDSKELSHSEGKALNHDQAEENDSFLVNDELLAKTLSIYEQISKEDELLLESFRAAEKTVGEDPKTVLTSLPIDSEPASVAHLKKIRLQPPRAISQESQSLFDILNRDFASISPRMTLKIAGISRPLSSDDVKLCFVAFVSCFSPPIKSHFATEYNYTKDDFGGLSGNFQSSDDSSVGSSSSGGHSKPIEREERPDPLRFTRSYVPNRTVLALWTDVIRCQFLDRPDITQPLAKKIEACRGDELASALNFIRDTLVVLGVLDVRKLTNGSHIKNDEERLSMEETFFFDSFQSQKQQQFSEVVSVHHDIHQEYGEYLIKSQHNELFNSTLEKYEKRWNAVVVDSFPKDTRSEADDSFMVHLLPWNTIRANRFRDAASLLADKKFLNKRLQALGVLEGTTAQVTDSEELILRHFEKRSTILCFESIDPDQTMLDVYERTRKDILRRIDEMEYLDDNDAIDLPHHLRSKELHIETGKALHLMGVSLGAQGFVEHELDFCKQALQLKRKVASGPTVTIADTLHCVGYSLDNAGAYLEAMELYNQALAIRRSLLGSDDIRVAETLHNKGAILCEHGECKDAMLCLEEALRIRMDRYGQLHESCADTQQWIGNVLREMGQFDQALPYFQTALTTKKAILGPDHEEVAHTLQNMAIVLDDLGKYKLSLDCYNEALRIYSLQFGKEHIRVADTLQRIAMDFTILEEHEQALDHFKQAIEIRERLLLDETCRLGDARFIIRSLIYSDEFDLDSAVSTFGDLIECYDEALAIAEKLEGTNHRAQSKMLHRLGDLFFEVQEYEKSIDSLEAALRSERAIAIHAQVDEENVCCMLLKMGLVNLYKKEYQRAKHCFESVVYRQRKRTGKDLEGEATALYCLGVAFDSLGAHKLSLAAFTEALNAWKDDCGESDVRCGYSLFWLGTEEFNAKRFDEAIIWCRGALRTFKQNKVDVDYAIVAKTLNLLGRTHEMLEDNESALRSYSEGIRLVRWKLGENHEFVIDMMCRSGKINQSLGLVDEAITFFEEAIAVMKNSKREDVHLCSTIETLALLFETRNDHDQARDLLTESYRMYESVVGQDDLRSAGAILKLGKVLDYQGSHEAAMQCYREALRVQQSRLSPDHEDIAETLYSMGANFAQSNRMDDSIKCLQQALSMQRNCHGDHHLLVARTLHELAGSYKVMGSFDKAIVCYKEALRIFGNSEKINSKTVARISYEMAESHEANDNFNAAALKYKEALGLWRDADDSDDQRLWLPKVLHKLGLVLLKAGDNEEALDYLSEALDILDEEGSQGINANLLSSSIAGLAKGFSSTGSFDCAIAFYQRHVDLLKSDSCSTEGVSDSLFAMGTIYARLNNLDDAISHFKECLLVRRDRFGCNDERVARVLINMGVVFERLEDFAAAKDCFTEGSRIYKLNGNERDASSSLQDLGRTLVKQGAFDSALDCFTEALQMRKKIYGSNDPQVASLHYTCGTTLFDKGDYEKALASFRQAVKIRNKMSSPNLEAAEALCMVGQTLVRLGEFEEAIESLNESLESLLLIKGPESIDVGNCHHALGLALSAKGDHKHAVSHFLEAVLPRQRYFGPESIEVADTHFELGEGYSQLGDMVSATEYSVSALRIRKIILGTETLEYGESVCQLGEIQLALSKFTEALNCFVEALKSFSTVEGRGHITVARCLEKIGLIQMELSQNTEGIESLKKALKIYTETFGGLSKQVANVLLALGRAEVRHVSYENALVYFKESLQISKELKQDEAVASALYEIGVLLENWGKGGEAFECYKESLRISESDENVTIRAKTLTRIGGVLFDQGNYPGSTKACEKALALFQGVKGPPLIEITDAYQVLAGLYEAKGEFEISFDYFQKAQMILTERLGPNHVSVARVLNNLSISHARMRDFTRAFELCCKALEIRKEKLGINNLDTCDTLYNIANIVDEWGKIDEAMKYYTEALEGYRNILGSEDIEVANCFQFIGLLHLKKEEDELAMRAFVEALRIYQALGEETKDLATILFNLGKIYNRRKDHEKALDVLAHSLRIQKVEGSDTDELACTCDQIGVGYAGKRLWLEAKTFFEKALAMLVDNGKGETIENAEILVHLGGVLSEEDAIDESLKHFTNALQIYKRERGESSDEVASTLVRIGLIHNKRVDYEEALRLLTSALRIRSAIFGSDAMKVAEILFEIGKVMEEWGDSDEALDTYGEVIRIVKIHFGQLHAMVAEATKRIGSIHVEKGDIEEALSYLNQAMVIQRRLLGESSVEIGHTLLSVGAVHDARSDEDAALASYSEALKHFKMNLGDDDLSVALALNNIGINYARRKNYSKAISMCTETLRIRRQKLGEEHLDVADSCLNIANILDEWGKDDEALGFYKESLALYKNHLGDDDVEVANCLSAVGGIYMKQNDHSRAVTCFLETIRIYRLKKGAESLSIAQALFNLGRVYGKIAEYDKSLVCFNESLRIRQQHLGESHADVIAVHRYIEAVERRRRS